MIHATERVKAIRERAAAGIQLVADLEAVVQAQDSYFRWHLRQIRNWLEDVESFFLESLTRESRTPAQESAWLDGADFALQMAARQLKDVQDAVAKYGPNVATAGG